MCTREVKICLNIYCEGESERNYFDMLRRNFNVKRYALKPKLKNNDLNRTLEKVGLEQQNLVDCGVVTKD
jgi:hypothetical protein